jgi:hypothetical protein
LQAFSIPAARVPGGRRRRARARTRGTTTSRGSFGDDGPNFIRRGYSRCPWCGHKADKDGVIEFLSDDPVERILQLDPNAEPWPEREKSAPGTTEITFGTWISPKSSGDG